MKLRYTVIVGASLVFLLASLLIATYFLSQGACNLGTFACSQGDVCVPQRAMCNGHADCPDGEDESAQTCGDFHGSSYIMNLMKEANFNKSIHKCEQSGVPQGCYCRRQDWVYCKGLHLTAVPTQIRGGVSRIILANNSISELSQDAFHTYNLELIHLEGNGIASLPPKIFHSQSRLRKILLMGNKLETIDDQIFHGLKNLSMLFLKDNRIYRLDANSFSDLDHLEYLDLSVNRVTWGVQGFPFVPNLQELLLDKNGISTLNEHDFDNVPSLTFLGLSYNTIENIHPNIFRNFKNLHELDLSHNRLKNLSPVLFSPLLHLKKLFLGFNPLETVSELLFLELHNMASLDLEEIEMENISVEMFDGMPHLNFITFKKYYYCTFIPQVPKCAPKSDGLSTFEDLLGRPILRIILWLVAILTCFGNIYVFWRRSTTRDDNRSLSCIVRNLANLLMGVYLIIIGIKDVEFRGIYHRVSHQWMGSWLCTIAGALAMLSSEVSILILVFMSIERFLLIAVPFSGRKTLAPRAAVWSLAVIWAVGFAVAACPIILYKSSTRFYGANAMCFPLHLDDPYFAGWKFSAFIFLIVNMIGLVLLAALYSGMFLSVWLTRHATCTVSSGDFEFAIRFFFIVLTNTACWLPIVILKVLAFYRIYISSAAYAWIAVVVVPVNSAFNPLLYTLTTPKYRELIRKAALRRTLTLRQSKPVTSVDTTCSNTSRGRLNTLETNVMSYEESLHGRDRPSGVSYDNDNDANNRNSLATFDISPLANSKQVAMITPDSINSATNQSPNNTNYDDVYM